MGNALLDTTKTDQWPIPSAVFATGFDKLRMQPSIGAVLDEARGALIGRGDFLITGSLRFALIAAIVAGNLRWVYDTVGALLGLDTPSGKALPEREGGERRPLAKVDPSEAKKGGGR
jgi:hypothetical protein